MSTPTTNYGFTKPDPTENPSTIVWGNNLDAIDTQIKAAQDVDPETWHYERWAYEGSGLVNPGDHAVTSNYLEGLNWTLYESEGNGVGSPIIFDMNATHGQWRIVREGVWRIYLTVTFTGIPTGASSGIIDLAIDRADFTDIRFTHAEAMELYQGTQQITAEWLADVRLDTSGDLESDVTYRFKMGQVNSSGVDINHVGGIETFETFCIFEQVRD